MTYPCYIERYNGYDTMKCHNRLLESGTLAFALEQLDTAIPPARRPPMEFVAGINRAYIKS